MRARRTRRASGTRGRALVVPSQVESPQTALTAGAFFSLGKYSRGGLRFSAAERFNKGLTSVWSPN
eukprot:3346424-Pyramimonas_sp.AAC.1